MDLRIKKIMLLILILIMGSQLCGYYIFNGRNHPELDWKKIESENIVLVYHDPLDDTAQEALKIAEATYASLTETYDLTLENKVKIFISNQDDIANGCSMAGRFIAIYVDINDYVNIFTGQEKWLRKVISHEMSHHFVFHSVKSWLDNFLPASALRFPSDFNEGYAMFLSGEEWGYGRSDASLRRAVYSNNLKYDYNDGFYYTTGFSMVRYLYEFYGVEKLQQLLKYRNELGLYDFNKAFKKVYHKSLRSFKEEWRRYIYTYYYGTGYELKRLSNSDSTSHFTLQSLERTVVRGWRKINELNMNDSALVIQGKTTPSQKYYDLVWGRYDSDTLTLDTLEIKNLIKFKRTNRVRNIDICSNSRFVTYVRNTRYKNGSIRPTIFRYDRKIDKTEKVIQGDIPQVNNAGEIFFQKLTHNKNYIKKYSGGVEENVLSFNAAQIGRIKLSPLEKYLTITRFDQDRRFLLEIYRISSKELIESCGFERMPREIIWSGEEEIIISIPSEKDSRTIIKKYSLVNNKWYEYVTPPYNVTPIREEKTDSTHRLLVMAELGRNSKVLGKIDLRQDSSGIFNPYHQNNYYNRWIRTQYPNKISVPDTIPEIKMKTKYNPFLDTRPWITLPIPDDKGFTFVNYWMDPLMKHNFAFAGYFPYRGNDPFYFINYTNNCWQPTIGLIYAQYDWIGGLWEGKLFYQDVKNLNLNFSFPVNFIDSPFLGINLGTNINYQNVKMQKKSFQEAPIFENGEALSLGGFVTFRYNLPYINSLYHPVRNLEFSYNLDAANSGLGMQRDFSDHRLEIDLGLAPLYDVYGLKIDQISLKNRTTIEWMNGNYFAQYQPGIDGYENLPLSGGIISARRYVRGIEKTLIGNRLLVSKNEVYAKLADDFKMSLVIGLPILDLKYTGIGAWFDYGRLWSRSKIKDFKSIGYEVKGILEIFNLPTVQRFGKAFDMKAASLGYYYRVDIPLIQNIY